MTQAQPKMDPKVQAQMEKQEKEITEIVYSLFTQNQDGKKLLNYLDQSVVKPSSLIAHPDYIAQSGGWENYMSKVLYLEGSRSVIEWFKGRIKAHENIDKPSIITN